MTVEASNRTASEGAVQTYRQSMEPTIQQLKVKKAVFEDSKLLKLHFESKKKALEYFDEQPKFGDHNELSEPFKSELESVSIIFSSIIIVIVKFSL
jgi:hypothetical protein